MATIKCKVCGKKAEPMFMNFCKTCYELEMRKIKQRNQIGSAK